MATASKWETELVCPQEEVDLYCQVDDIIRAVEEASDVAGVIRGMLSGYLERFVDACPVGEGERIYYQTAQQFEQELRQFKAQYLHAPPPFPRVRAGFFSVRRVRMEALRASARLVRDVWEEVESATALPFWYWVQTAADEDGEPLWDDEDGRQRVQAWWNAIGKAAYQILGRNFPAEKPAASVSDEETAEGIEDLVIVESVYGSSQTNESREEDSDDGDYQNAARAARQVADHEGLLEDSEDDDCWGTPGFRRSHDPSWKRAPRASTPIFAAYHVPPGVDEPMEEAAPPAPGSGHPPLPRQLYTVPNKLPSEMLVSRPHQTLSCQGAMGDWRGHGDDRYVLKYGWRQPVPMLSLPPGMQWVIEPWVGPSDALGRDTAAEELLYGVYCHWVQSIRVYATRLRHSAYRRHLGVWEYTFAEIVLGVNLTIDSHPLFLKVPPQMLASFYFSFILELSYCWAAGALPRSNWEKRRPYPEAWRLPANAGERQAAVTLGATGPMFLLYPHQQGDAPELRFDQKAVARSQNERFGAWRPPAVTGAYFGMFLPHRDHDYRPYGYGQDWPTHFTVPLIFRTPEMCQMNGRMGQQWIVLRPYQGIFAADMVAAYETSSAPTAEMEPSMDHARARGEYLFHLIDEYFG